MIYTRVLSAAFRAWYGDPPAVPDDAREGRGLVLLADGVGGLDLCGTALRHVVAAEGLACDVNVIPWGHGFGRWHADLTNVVNRDLKARLVADEAIAFRAQSAGPLFLVGKSGGTGVVVKALEHLPEGAAEAAVLIAPALSPGYDLTRALDAVRREMVVFWSPLDVFVLGLGTRVFGTIDGAHAASAGLVGFRVPLGDDGAPEGAYAKLRQVRWGLSMATTGYLGGHVGPDSPAFLRKYVVPLLRPGGA